MSGFTVKTYTTRTTEEEVSEGLSGQDVREDTHEFEDVEGVCEFLTREGLQSPSASPIAGNEMRVWFSSLDPYLDPYGNWREEVTAHPGEDIPPAVWADIVTRVTWPSLR